MQILAIIAASLFLSAGYAYDDEENLLGLPVEYDIFGLDFREDLDKDRDIFKEQFDTYQAKPDTTLLKLCQEFDLLLDNRNVDCASIKFVPKGLRSYQHYVQRRDADEIEPEDGSGESEEKLVTEATNKEPETKLAEVPELEEGPKESENPPPSAEEPQPEKEQENTEAPLPIEEKVPAPEAPNDEEVPKEAPSEAPTEQVVPSQAPIEQVVPSEAPIEQVVPSEAPIEQVVPAEAPKEEIPKEAQSEAPVEQIVPIVLTSEKPKEEHVGPQAKEPSVDNSNDKAPLEPVTEGIFVKEENVLLGAVPKKGRKLTHGLSEEENLVTDAAAPVEADKFDSEKLNEHQSGVAILESAGSAGTLEASDNAVKHMATNAEIKGASSNVHAEEPKSGESAKDAQEGRQDTKVLIILFVAVVVIGAAAFAYNFVKKRKAKQAEAARSENGVNPTLQRSFQNVSGKDKNDPEHGTELKPLMKTGEKPVVEYKDEKGNGKTEGAN